MNVYETYSPPRLLHSGDGISSIYDRYCKPDFQKTILLYKKLFYLNMGVNGITNSSRIFYIGWIYDKGEFQKKT